MKKIVLIVMALTMGLTMSCQDKVNASDDKEAKIENTANKSEKAVKTLSKEEFKQLVHNFETNKEWNFEGDLPCIVDFYADWCRPCKIAAPILEEIAQEYKGKINVYKVDTQKHPEVAGIFGVKGIPAFLYCPKEGEPRMSAGIGRSAEETKDMFRKAIDEILLK